METGQQINKNALPKSQTQKGIILKNYEYVLARLLSTNIPNQLARYVSLPRLDEETSSDDDFLNYLKERIKNPNIEVVAPPTLTQKIVDEVLQLTCHSNALPNQSYKRRGARPMSKERAKEKQTQIRSLIRCVLSMIPDEKNILSRKSAIRIIDFAGGSGHLAIPLSILLPNCEVILLDLKKASLDLARQRSSYLAGKLYWTEIKQTNTPSGSRPVANDGLPQPQHKKLQETDFPNLKTFHGDISSFDMQFDIGISLHACGESTDLALRKSAEFSANFISSPCCIGKLNRGVRNPYIYQATMGNTPTVEYPQSNNFKSVLKPEDWDHLAKAADYGEGGNVRNYDKCEYRRMAKSLVEMDRLLYMKNDFGYDCYLTKMEDDVKTPKNDILVGWKQPTSNDPNKELHLKNGEESSDRLVFCYDKSTLESWTLRFEKEMYFLGNALRDPVDHSNGSTSSSENNKALESTGIYTQQARVAMTEWDEKEYENVQSILSSFLENDEETTYKFPKGQASRLRKLVHFVAENMDLRHWSEGKRNTERMVIVAKKKKRKTV